MRFELYREVQAHLHDDKNGGWFEQADRQWKLLAPGDRRNQFDLIGSKSANAHLHWMEALTELYEASRELAVKESLIEALRLNQTYFFPANPANYRAYRRFDWRAVTDPGYNELSYGHSVEFPWLMVRAERVLGRDLSWDRFYALLDHALKYGYDAERGGLYNRGFEEQPATDREKIWWVQAEMLAALTEALNHQSDVRYAVALEKLLDFVRTYQTSSEDGIWLTSVTADRAAAGTGKATSWKANYHDLRAILKFVRTFD